MDKILVEIYLPVADKSYDVYIPLKSKIHEVVTLLSGSFAEILEGYFIATNDTVLCYKVTGNILDVNMSAEELNLKNGSKLILI